MSVLQWKKIVETQFSLETNSWNYVFIFLGGIVLDRSMPPQNIPPMRGEEKKISKIEDNQFAFSPDNLDTSSPEFLDAMGAKAHLIIRMLENR